MLCRFAGALAIVVATAACAGPLTLPPDVAATDAARDATTAGDVGPSRDAAGDAASALDVLPTVDVTWFDAGAPADAPHDDAASADSPTAVCATLAEQYASTVRAAQRCGSASDCATLVCETLCCACQVFTSATASQLDTLMRLQTAWRAERCTDRISCTTTPCDPAAVAECSSTGRCTTIRRPAGGG